MDDTLLSGPSKPRPVKLARVFAYPATKKGFDWLKFDKCGAFLAFLPGRSGPCLHLLCYTNANVKPCRRRPPTRPVEFGVPVNFLIHSIELASRAQTATTMIFTDYLEASIAPFIVQTATFWEKIKVADKKKKKKATNVYRWSISGPTSCRLVRSKKRLNALPACITQNLPHNAGPKTANDRGQEKKNPPDFVHLHWQMDASDKGLSISSPPARPVMASCSHVFGCILHCIEVSIGRLQSEGSS